MRLLRRSRLYGDRILIHLNVHAGDKSYCSRPSNPRQLFRNLLKEFSTPHIQSRRVTDEWLYILF